jgi:hypothetical protein
MRMNEPPFGLSAAARVFTWLHKNRLWRCFLFFVLHAGHVNSRVAPPPPCLRQSGTESAITEAITGLLYQPQMMVDGDECGSVSGMLGRGTGSFPPQIPHNLTLAAAVGIRRLTASATALPSSSLVFEHSVVVP